MAFLTNISDFEMIKKSDLHKAIAKKASTALEVKYVVMLR